MAFFNSNYVLWNSISQLNVAKFVSSTGDSWPKVCIGIFTVSTCVKVSNLLCIISCLTPLRKTKAICTNSEALHYLIFMVQAFGSCPSVSVQGSHRTGRGVAVPLWKRFSNFFKWGPLSLVRMFYGPPYSWDYQTH